MSNDQKTILIVDDTPTTIGIISAALKDQFKTKVATNGEKALALANADKKPDLILLDVMMPIMDGYEVCRRIKPIQIRMKFRLFSSPLRLTSKTRRRDSNSEPWIIFTNPSQLPSSWHA